MSKAAGLGEKKKKSKKQKKHELPETIYVWQENCENGCTMLLTSDTLDGIDALDGSIVGIYELKDTCTYTITTELV